MTTQSPSMENAPAAEESGPMPIASALLGTLGMFALVQTLAYMRAGGLFEYPLDDVYIHLAMASEIARGGYGVNSGEFASAASSALYPLFLLPIGGADVQRFLPLFWNAAAVTCSGLLLAAIIGQSGLARHISGARLTLLVLTVALAANIAIVGFAGMENALHTTATLAIIYGLIVFVTTGRIGRLLVLGIVLAPLLRFEGLALAILASSYVVLRGPRVAGLLLLTVAVLPIAGFVGFLTLIDVGPLPSSVVAKLSDIGPKGTRSLSDQLAWLFRNLEYPAGIILFGLTIVMAFVGIASRDRGRRELALLVATAGAAHFVLGRIGWLDRYENYILAGQIATAVYVLTGPMGAGIKRLSTVMVAAGVLAALVFYQNNFALRGQYAPLAIHLQHGQMARFAQDFLKAPVAVNDLGRVVWGNDHYVLDLWGLASREALVIRQEGGRTNWAGDLAKAKAIRVAMLYDRWFEHAPGTDWIRLGVLVHGGPGGYLGGREVTFYATDAQYLEAILAALGTWADSLPPGTDFTFSDTLEIEVDR